MTLAAGLVCFEESLLLLLLSPSLDRDSPTCEATTVVNVEIKSEAMITMTEPATNQVLILPEADLPLIILPVS